MRMENQIGSPTSPLLKLPDREDQVIRTGHGRDEVVEEVKKQLFLAVPLICESLLLYCIQMISLMFVGRLDQLALSSASLATSLSVLAFNLLMGMSTALETLCGQSFGAKRYNKLGIYTQRGMLTLTLVTVPTALALACTRRILITVGQDPEISEAAGSYACFLIPSLFAYALLQCVLRFLRAQNNIFPMMVSSGVTAVLHVFNCWLLIHRCGLGNRGAALAISISYWFNLLLLALYVNLSLSCKSTWTGFSKEALKDILPFLKLAIPSGIMLCVETWTFQLMIFLGGLLPDPELQTSVLSVSHNVTVFVYMIPMGLSSAISIRISNELGAQNPTLARLAIRVVLKMAATQGILLGGGLFLLRNIWGHAYTSDLEVIHDLAAMTPILAVSYFLDGFQCVLSGICRGCGRQKLGAYMNFISYYLVGVPLAVVFAFVLHINGKGLWLGLICALVVQNFLLIAIIACTNWDKETRKAIERQWE